MKRNDIDNFASKNDIKAAVAEHFNCTITSRYLYTNKIRAQFVG